MAFDLTDGDLAANNVATITGFSTDGVLGAASTSGGASGALPGMATIADSAFFNELLQDITLGNTMTFTLELTAHYSGSGVPDAFAFFLLDATSGLPLFPTADSTGADALFAVDITGTALGDLQIFSTSVQVTSVPEPASFWLVVAGLGGLAACRRWSRRLRTVRLTPREYVDGQAV